MALFGFGRKQEEKAQAAACGMSPEGIRSVQVLGGGCRSCHELYENTRAAVRALGLELEVEYITDLERVMACGAMTMPVVTVNGQVVSAGRVMKAAEVEALLRRLCV